ncbi:triose-phosphate transporter family-domain-containing protein [Cladorrhinum samala]|uniref:Triose-phosphate transporter family-domain-containing protein n=1 Tax=Cladorrhinum samala TaxID=585594 RepID=A0AAV9HYH3_9PEZI|nr:triose-phosphate transporter family-domain-containing protein [Cladorrhinum samala]
MPHSTAPAHSSAPGTEKFPDFHDDAAAHSVGHVFEGKPQNGSSSFTTTAATTRRDSRVKWSSKPPPSSYISAAYHGHGHGHSRRRSSISNAIQRLRSGSMREGAHEMADALRAPISWTLIALCVAWYWSSALTNTSSKSILTAFPKPATLTLVQFAFVSSYCLLFSFLAQTFPNIRAAVPALKHPIRYPSRDVIRTTLPLAAFQIFGHLLSSTATSKIPVSLVHTIKGLSPLFTVLAYRFVYDIRYPKATYLSLIPLTIGVMLACSSSHTFNGQFLGILYALLATIIFVTQNIFSKRLFNEAARAEAEGLGHQSRKLDKLNLLCYSSGMAFILTLPIWFWSEGFHILTDFLYDGSVDLTVSPNSFDHGRLTLEYVFNGTFHFGQNILAFVLLSTVSPVTYSVASLIKRVFVITIAIIWFRSKTTNLQAVGIALTFLGLYLYDRSSEKNKADQRARSMTETRRAQASLLPLNNVSAPSAPPPVNVGGYSNGYGYSNGAMLSRPSSASHYRSPSRSHHIIHHHQDSKKSDDGPLDGGMGRPRGQSNANSNPVWLAPGTRAEDTWRKGDDVNGSLVAAR